jgi:hypothetical protein
MSFYIEEEEEEEEEEEDRFHSISSKKHSKQNVLLEGSFFCKFCQKSAEHF